MSRQHLFGRTTKTGVRDFCDMSYPLAGPDRSQSATTERHMGRKPRKFRGKFESMPCPENFFYNNDLGAAEEAGFELKVSDFNSLTVPPQCCSVRATSCTRIDWVAVRSIWPVESIFGACALWIIARVEQPTASIYVALPTLLRRGIWGSI